MNQVTNWFNSRAGLGGGINGQTVGGGLANSVLYIDSSGNLKANSPNLTFNGTVLTCAGDITSGTRLNVGNTGPADNILVRTSTGGTLYEGMDNSVGSFSGTAYATICYRPSSTIYVLSRNGTVDIKASGAGLIQFAQYGSGAATFDSSGNITAVSDESQKTNIRPFTRGLAEVLKLAPILHGYSEESGLDQSRDDYAGFGAGAVKKIIPEAVGKMQDQIEPEFLPPGLIVTDRRMVNPNAKKLIKEGALTLNPFVILAAMVNAIKELNAKLDMIISRLSAAGIK